MYRSGSTVSVLRHMVASASDQQTRGMATLKDISVRLKSVKNIQKITQSMKMVAAAKYNAAERGLKPARPYGEGAQKFYEHCEVAEKPQEHLMIVMTSDRGLCGAVHSNLGRMVKRDMEHLPAEQKDHVKIFCVGDKAKAILQRIYAKNMIMAVNEIGKRPPTFEDAAALAQAVLNQDGFKKGDIYFNRFRTVVSYTSMKLPVYSADTMNTSEKLSMYDSLDSQVLQSYMEYSLASLFYYVLKEGACSEQSARMTAMDAATKNAGEMIDKLTLYFNRTRQAVITRELIEIISGAAAL